jgi:hypothetical protein
MNSDNGYSSLRGGTTFITAEEDRDISYWRSTYKAQDRARDANKQEKLRSGGDESIFRKIRVLPENIAEAEEIRFSESGLLLDIGIHRISGPPGAGKTRLAYWEVIQRVSGGQKWAILDAEMGQIRYKQAMKQLGADDGILRDIYYMDALDGGVPDILEHGRALSRLLQRGGYHGILYDSQITFLGASGVSENDAHDVRSWTVAVSGMPCVVILDHTGHVDDTRSRGTSDKAAGCDVDLMLKPVRPFTMGMPGSISISANKDRSGTLAVGSYIEIEIECLGSDRMDFVPGAWNMERADFEVTVADLINMITMDDKREFVTAGELQGKLRGRKQNRLEQIRNAVENGEIVEFYDGRKTCYSVA